jgi:acyl-CoA thioesterase FadM
MHYSNFFRFMEGAEHAFFRSIGFSVVAAAGIAQGRMAAGACLVRLPPAAAV